MQQKAHGGLQKDSSHVCLDYFARDFEVIERAMQLAPRLSDDQADLEFKEHEMCWQKS